VYEVLYDYGMGFFAKSKIIFLFLLLLIPAAVFAQDDADTSVPEPLLPEESTDPIVTAQMPYSGMEELRAAVNTGDKQALFYMATIYFTGTHGIKQDEKSGVAMLQKSMQLGYLPAKAYLGRMYYYGAGIAKNSGKGLKLLASAAKSGSQSAKFDLAKIDVYSGDPAKADRGRKKLQTLASSGYIEAQEEIGSNYLYGEHGYPVNYDKALKYLRLAVKSGSESARYKVAMMYLYGKGVNRDKGKVLELLSIAGQNGFSAAIEGEGDADLEWGDYSDAEHHYEEAAKAGFVSALDKLGRLYAGGKGVTKSTATAEKYFREAGAKGYPQAYADLGKMYLAQGVSVSNDLAVTWLEKASSNGYADADLTLGLMYSTGKGVPLNEEKAYQWFLKAAQAGIPEGREEAADRLMEGRGVTRDEKTALSLYAQAAQTGAAYAAGKLAAYYYENDPRTAFTYAEQAAYAGDAHGMLLLGKLYEDGKAAGTDLKKSYKWLTLAQWKGADASQQIFALERVMKPEDISDAKRDALWQRDNPGERTSQ